MLIIPTKQIIHINNFNFNKKYLIHFNKFNGNDQIALIFHKSKSNCINFHKFKLKEIRETT